MKALRFERRPARFVAANLAGRVVPGRGAKFGPLQLADVEEPGRPTADWVRFRPRLAGICGSDLATIDATSSRYFEPIVSFPFVLGHEVVGDLDDGTRAVLIPVLHCETRGLSPVCASCAAGAINRCERIAFGHLEPGLQSGYCESTGGGWSVSMVAHPSQLLAVPESVSDEAAVLIEPMACAVHAARQVTSDDVVFLGAGTLGLLTIAALRALRPDARIAATAKYPEQHQLARELGANVTFPPSNVVRMIRTVTSSMMVGDYLTGGAPVVVDCVGSESSLSDALKVVAPGGTVLVVGMPGHTSLDLTALWQRESALRGCYAYTRDDFTTALELVDRLDLGRLVSATYPLDRYEEAIEHAAASGLRGAVKIAFDMRNEKQRNDL